MRPLEQQASNGGGGDKSNLLLPILHNSYYSSSSSDGGTQQQSVNNLLAYSSNNNDDTVASALLRYANSFITATTTTTAVVVPTTQSTNADTYYDFAAAAAAAVRTLTSSSIISIPVVVLNNNSGDRQRTTLSSSVISTVTPRSVPIDAEHFNNTYDDLYGTIRQHRRHHHHHHSHNNVQHFLPTTPIDAITESSYSDRLTFSRSLNNNYYYSSANETDPRVSSRLANRVDKARFFKSLSLAEWSQPLLAPPSSSSPPVHINNAKRVIFSSKNTKNTFDNNFDTQVVTVNVVEKFKNHDQIFSNVKQQQFNNNGMQDFSFDGFGNATQTFTSFYPSRNDDNELTTTASPVQYEDYSTPSINNKQLYSADDDAQNPVIITPANYFVPLEQNFYQMMTTMVDSALADNSLQTWSRATPASRFAIINDSFTSNTTAFFLAHEFDGSSDSNSAAMRAAVLGIIFILMIIVTVIGNLFVIAAVYYERPLRKMTCNYYIVSLAVSDLMLGALIVPFSSLQEVTGEWLFGSYWCTGWLSLDVLCTSSSILGLMVISVDRYLAVTRPLNYYRYSSTKFVVTAVVGLWALSMLITTAPVFGFEGLVVDPVTGLVQCNVGGGLVWTLYSAVGSFFFPLSIMVVLNLRIYKIAERQSAALHEEFKRLQHIYSHLGPPDGDTVLFVEDSANSNNNHFHENTTTQQHKSANEHTVGNGPTTVDGNCLVENNNNGKMDGNHNNADSCAAAKHDASDGHKRSSDSSLGAKARNLLSSSSSSRNNHVSTRSVHKMRRFSKQHRAAKTLFFVMACFTICWLPFFTIYLIEGIATHWQINLIGPLPFKIAFWLGYFNSALNPFIYAVSNRDFRRAFQKLFHCYYCRDYSDWHDTMRKPSWAMYHRPSSSVTERTRLHRLQRASSAACGLASPMSLDFGHTRTQQIGNNNNNKTYIEHTDDMLLINTAAPNNIVASNCLTEKQQSDTPELQRIAAVCEELRQTLAIAITLPVENATSTASVVTSRRTSSVRDGSPGAASTASAATTTASSAQQQQRRLTNQLSVESPNVVSSVEHHHLTTIATSTTTSRAKQKRPSIIVSPENANEMALAIYVGDEYDKEFFRSFRPEDEDDEDEDNYEGSYSLHPTTTASRPLAIQNDKQQTFRKRRQISAPIQTGTGGSMRHRLSVVHDDGTPEIHSKTAPSQRRKLSATITASASFLFRTLQGKTPHNRRRLSHSDQSTPIKLAEQHDDIMLPQQKLLWNSEPDALAAKDRRRIHWNDSASSSALKKRQPITSKTTSDKQQQKHAIYSGSVFTDNKKTASRLARSFTMPVKYGKQTCLEGVTFHDDRAEKPASLGTRNMKNQHAKPNHNIAKQHDSVQKSAAVSKRHSIIPAECPRCGLDLQAKQRSDTYFPENTSKHDETHAAGARNEQQVTTPVLYCSVGINTEPLQFPYEPQQQRSQRTTNGSTSSAAKNHHRSAHATIVNECTYSDRTERRNQTKPLDAINNHQGPYQAQSTSNLSSGQDKVKQQQCGVQTSYSVFDMGSF